MSMAMMGRVSLEQAKSLVEFLETDQQEKADELIAEIQNPINSELFAEIGKLTRQLHDSLTNFNIDSRLSDLATSEIPDAKERLNYVITRTEEAANKTMDVVEDIMPLSSSLGGDAKELHDEWQRFMRKEIKPEEFRELTKKIDGFLSTTVEKTASISGHLTTVLLAQDYQDLTGQVIKRVINLVQEVEDNLVELVKMAGTVDYLTGTEHSLPEKKEEVDALVGEGPIINPEKRDDVLTGQDDVDDLLSSLGF